MLYELVAIVRTGNLTYVKDAARTTGSYILKNSGVIRSLNNYGVFDLPRPITKLQSKHHKGHYFTLTFDAPSAVQSEIRRQLSLNPHMIRFSVVKVGDKLGGARNQYGKIEDVTGEMEWSNEATNNITRQLNESKGQLPEDAFGQGQDRYLPKSDKQTPHLAFTM